MSVFIDSCLPICIDMNTTPETQIIQPGRQWSDLSLALDEESTLKKVFIIGMSMIGITVFSGAIYIACSVIQQIACSVIQQQAGVLE